jgi:hypothetical protein
LAGSGLVHADWLIVHAIGVVVDEGRKAYPRCVTTLCTGFPRP